MKAQQLKNSILQQAMQGKLVPQDSNDEPASVLLERIQEEKEQLIQDKVIKREKALPPITDDEIPFEIPDSWEWVRLQKITKIIGDGLHGTPNYDRNGGYYFINGSNLKDGKILITDSTKKVSEDIYSRNKKILDDSTILMSINGSLGNLAKYNNEPIMLGKSAAYITLINKGFLDYIYIYFLSDEFKKYYGTKYTGTTIKNIPLSALRSCVVPIPPKTEQQRIVAKIEELFKKVDQYDVLEQQLTSLNNTFPVNMEKSILQHAMQGKLVEQDPNDERASVLVERIQEEKEQLIQDKIIKREKALPPITDDEIPFEIPDSWEWVRLNDMAYYIQRGKSPVYSEIKKIPVVSQKCVQWSGFTLEKAKFIDPETKDKYTPIRFLKEYDLLWNSTGLGTLGRIGIYYGNVNEYGIAVSDSHVTVIRLFYADIISKFIYYFLASPHVQSNIEEFSSGTTKQRELSTTTVKNFVVPLPPLSEQQRIVGKIEETMELTNRLKMNTTNS